MNKTFFASIFLFVFLLNSCNSKSKNQTETNSFKDTTKLVLRQKKENFNTFFNRFQEDSVFQIKRIEFPIKYYIHESGSYMDDSGNIVDLSDRVVIVNKNEWKYQNFNEYEKIISEINGNEYNVELQIVDTGVSINYIFKIYNDKWYLIEIKDESA